MTTNTTAHAVDEIAAIRLTEHSTDQIDFATIRHALRTIEEREALGRFIKAGWTASEFAEFARAQWRVPGKTKPTASSYQRAVWSDPESVISKQILNGFRRPGFVMPALDRPVVKRAARIAEDHPDNPAHSAELKADVETLARRYMARADDWNDRPRRGLDTPVTTQSWKRCFKDLRRNSGSLEQATYVCGLSDYRDVVSAQ